MKAYRFDAFGDLDHLALHDEPIVAPGTGEVLVKVHAVALNYRDVAIPLGRHPAAHAPGLIPTSDAAGEIVAVGPGADPFAVGDRVISTFHPRWTAGPPPASLAADQYGRGRDGWLCEYKTVRTDAIVALPDAIPTDTGATLPCAGLTAWTCLSGPDPIRAGRTVLTLGTGGVSLFAVQLAKACGARVVATTSFASKAARLAELGADLVIDYREVGDWGARARAFAGGIGVDRVVEVGGPATLPQSLLAVAEAGEIALVGFLGGIAAPIDFGALFRSGASIRQVRVGHRAALEELVAVIAAHKIAPVIDRVLPFEDASAAFRHVETGYPFGKTVIRLV